MNEHQLSKRLSAVASLIPNGSRIADIGSDHAYLPIHLILQGKISLAIAGEKNDGPYQLAKSNVKKFGLTSVIEVRKGDGLEVIEPGEVDVVVIAGMGASLIVQILENGLEKLAQVKRIVVQPNLAAHLLRRWFMEHGWELKEEKIIEEDEQFYEILMAEPGDGQAPYLGLGEREMEQALLMGPYLLKEKNEVFLDKWTGELRKRKRIIASLEQARGEEKEERLHVILEEKKLIEEALSR